MAPTPRRPATSPKTKVSRRRGGESACALLLIDVINELRFPGAKAMLPEAKRAAKRLHALATRARARGVPVIYVNDNFGLWRSDFRALIERCGREGCPGREICELLAPQDTDYFVLKPMNSAFYSTVLDTLLRYLGVTRVILGGFATDNCVLFTAHDAHLRDYDILVPRDCVAATSHVGQRRALVQMRRHLRADTRIGSALDLAALRRHAR